MVELLGTWPRPAEIWLSLNNSGIAKILLIYSSFLVVPAAPSLAMVSLPRHLLLVRILLLGSRPVVATLSIRVPGIVPLLIGLGLIGGTDHIGIINYIDPLLILVKEAQIYVVEVRDLFATGDSEVVSVQRVRGLVLKVVVDGLTIEY